LAGLYYQSSTFAYTIIAEESKQKKREKKAKAEEKKREKAEQKQRKAAEKAEGKKRTSVKKPLGKVAEKKTSVRKSKALVGKSQETVKDVQAEQGEEEEEEDTSPTGIKTRGGKKWTLYRAHQLPPKWIPVEEKWREQHLNVVLKATTKKHVLGPMDFVGIGRFMRHGKNSSWALLTFLSLIY
jgi:hypothetical protein